MEVHPPEHPIHTWRDFFVHIATIVVGLLIAIGLEQSVEWLHHRHQVHTAHANLQAEAQINLHKLVEDQQSLAATRLALVHDIDTLRAIQKDPRAAQGATLQASWKWESFEESAFDTARDTGTFLLMPYSEVQEINSVYRQQAYVHQELAEYVLSIYRLHTFQAGGRTLADLSPAEINSTLTSASEALTQLSLMQDLMRSLHEEFTQLAQ